MKEINGQNIIDFLQSKTTKKFPKQGIIAGQSVAEAYFRLNNIPIVSRIKDIDIFFKTNQNIRDEEYFKIKEKPINVSQIGLKTYFTRSEKLKNKHSLNEEANNVDDYMGFESFYRLYDKENVNLNKAKYKINNVFELENVNVIILEGTPIINKDFLRMVVDNFDINIVQIGVCLESKEIYMTNQFKEFLKSRQLKIINFGHPYKSLLRFLEKESYIDGIYSDYEYESNLVYILNQLKNKNLKTNRNNYLKKVSYEHYLAINKPIKKLLLSKFNIKTHNYLIEKEVFFPIKAYMYLNGLIIENLVNIKTQMSKIDKIEVIFPENINIDIDILNKKGINVYVNSLNNTTNLNEKFLLQKIEASIRYLMGDQNIIKYNKYFNKDRIIHDDLNKSNAELNNCKVRHSVSKQLVDGVILKVSNNLKCFNLGVKNNMFNKNVVNNVKKIKSLDIYDKLNFSQLNILNKREFLENFYSETKVDNIIKYIKGQTFINLIDKYILENDFNNLNTFFKVKNIEIKKMIIHNLLYFKLNLLYKINEKELNIRDLYKKVNYLEKLNISLIGAFEKSNLPISIFLKDFKEFKNEVDGINKEYEKIMFRLKKMEVFKLDEKYLNIGNGYKVSQICNPYILSEHGREMSHCVGGYKKQLMSKTMLFFDIYTNEKERRTLSLYINMMNDLSVKLKFDQYKGKKNYDPFYYNRYKNNDGLIINKPINDEKTIINNFINDLEDNINKAIKKDNTLIQ